MRSEPRALLCALGLGLALALLPACTTWQAARLYHHGTAALDAGEPERAIRLLEREAQLRPEVSEIQNHLGLAYQAAGREEEALAAFEHAVALDCSNQPAQENLAVTRARQRVSRIAQP